MPLTLEQKIDRVLTKLDRVEANSRPKPAWVPASWIMDLTGWDAKKMEIARAKDLITWRDNKSGGYDYDASSVPAVFIKKGSA